MDNKLLIRLSNIISYLLHPLALTTVMAFLLLFGNSVMSMIPLTIKLYFLGMTAITTLVIPALLTGIYKVFDLLPRMSRNERTAQIPSLVAAAACYIMCYFILRRLDLAFLLNKIVIAAAACALASLIVSLFYRVSLHMAGMGGLLAILAAFNFSGFGTMPYTMMAFIFLAGLLASARLYLGNNYSLQLALSFIGGVVIAAVVFLFA